MSAHNTIVVKGTGHFIEGKLASGQTPKPGQCITIKSDGTYEVYNAALDGDRRSVIVLVDAELLGQLKTTAYADGARFFAYIPNVGDELQVLVADTEDAIIIGDLLIIDDGTGKCIETIGTPEMEPFEALEALGTISVDTHCLVRYTGH